MFANGYTFHRSHWPYSLNDRLLTPDKGRTPYSRRTGEAKTVEHWGQRKLLLSEIEFLMMHATKDTTVVYAGAAPGSHTNFLSGGLFPHVNFVLVDPANFDAWQTDRIEIRQEYFTEKVAKELAATRAEGMRLVFISDIRSTDHKMSHEEQEERILLDMRMQQEWVRQMQPDAAMLKSACRTITARHQH